MSIIDEQIAEIEALAELATQGTWTYIEHVDCDYIAGPDAEPIAIGAAENLHDGYWMAAANPANILAIISRLRAAEMDAARYRWLKDQGHFRAMSMDMGGNHSWIGMGRAIGKGPTVDEAIDAAIKHKPNLEHN